MITEYLSTDLKCYSDIEFAGLLGISLGRLRNKLCAGKPLPPRIQPPGCRRRLWPRHEVHERLEQFIIVDAPFTASEPTPRQPGRPTKAEARARRR